MLLRRFRLTPSLVFVLFLAGCVSFGASKWDTLFGPEQVQQREFSQLPEGHTDYWLDVKPVLDQRCIVCHGCYDAPCQLKLTAIEGIDRGASKANVYETSRIKPASMTRLFEDAHSTEAWREKGFFPVLNEREQTPEANRQAGLMHRSLIQKSMHPLPDTNVLPADFTLGTARKNHCPTAEEYEKFAEKNPLWGMPYALPGLNDEEQNTLLSWLEEGALYTARAPLSDALKAEVTRWEKRLNGDSLKDQLSARYIFEHLFLAHLYFNSSDEPTFFKMVRSSTPPGTPLVRISTRRPYDDPGIGRVYYRLVPEYESIVKKTHMPYLLDDARWQRWREWFFNVDFKVETLPSYAAKVASNPFKSFSDLPVESRYRFMLDEAQFTIMNFIKGPVCRGQVALNVIRDQFWVFFVDPDVTLKLDLATLLKDQQDDLELPSAKGNVYTPYTTWRKYASKQREFLEARDEYLMNHAAGEVQLDLHLIWDGDGHNPNAALTVFRHFDTATVEKGLIGPYPRTAWVIDYTLLERIHYLLVAGYDVYGNVGHQLLSRLFMDFLRMEGESDFLFLLPSETRDAERTEWYEGASDDVLEYMTNIGFEDNMEPDIEYQTDNPKLELYHMLEAHLDSAIDRQHALDTLPAPVAEPLIELSTFSGSATTLLPETNFIEIYDASSGERWYASLLVNQARSSMTNMLREASQHLPEANTVTVAHGLIGAYPNAFFRVSVDELPDFVQRVRNMSNTVSFADVVNRYGVRRTSEHFWQFSDMLHSNQKQADPVEFGWYDFNRLQNH